MFSLLATLMLIHDEKTQPSGAFNSVVFEISAICRDPTTQWMLLTCLMVWCGTFLFLNFSLKDLPLIGLLLITIAICFISHAALSGTDALTLLAGGTLGKGTNFILKSGKRKAESGNILGIRNFLIGLIAFLAFASQWHLEVAHNFYPGTRWTGLWDNPNIYGMLMGAGVTLTIGLLAASPKSKVQGPKSAESAEENTVRDSRSLFLRIFLFIAAGMMRVGLLFSYSRGAWVGTAIGLVYLAKVHGKLKWWWVLPGVLASTAVVVVFWHSTADNGPWYLKRLDLSRPSAQHRVAAWHGAVQMMRDHPFGVGWNKAVETYEKRYSPPEGGAAALAMNSYLMLGTELGLPGLICFVAYAGLALKQKSEVRSQESESITLGIGHRTLDSLQAACRAGALVLLVAFWFDGGLFELATAAPFWILLELGASDLIADKTC